MDDPVTAQILGFLDRIGIIVESAALKDETFLPAMSVHRGKLLVDMDRLEFPGDLLHEAGHIAVTDPAVRDTLEEISPNPAEEMAAMCWSYAAAVAIGLDASIVFHEQGYRGEGPHLAQTYAGGSYIGLPMLQWYGMTIDAKNAEAAGAKPYPHMQRWLR